MFMAGRSPAFLSSEEEFGQIVRRLERKGYTRHLGPRIQRWTELGAWRRTLDDADRQIHVQCLRRQTDEGPVLEWFAHTEPSGWGLRHLIAALTDRVSYQHGARILRDDLGNVRLVKSARRVA